MPSGRNAVSCVPCAKRKVRCDKIQPCSHCKRRKQDTCVYPESNEISPQLLRQSSEYIEKLERYIRRLGGNPTLANEALSPFSPGRQTSLESTNLNDLVQNNSNIKSKARNDLSMPVGGVHLPVPSTSELLVDGDGATLIETPMWFSWNDPSHTSDGHGQNPKTSNAHYLPTILHQRQMSDCKKPFEHRSLATHLGMLWSLFLKNVHPLVKIFFDWEVVHVIEKAQQYTSALSTPEQALLYGIRFLATLSMTREECQEQLLEAKHEQLLRCQTSLEHALIDAEYAETADKSVLQAFMLYILAMRERARPAALFSLMGIATRVAERIGLQHDGSMFGLNAVRCEERRRMWWQLQWMELAITQKVGTLSLTIFANWDTKMPSNVEDYDISPGKETVPSERKGITSISPCLWRYSILHMNREARKNNKLESMDWFLSPHVAVAEKDARIDEIERMLREKFLQHCELLNPLHVYLQIGIRQFVLASRSNARQLTLANAKISEMLPQARDDLLRICSKSLEYFVLSQTTSSIARYTWVNDNFFGVASFVYLLLEAYQRSENPQVVDLWSLIARVYNVHPDLTTAVNRPEVTFIARITIAAWRKYDAHIRQQHSSVHGATTPDEPEWIQQLSDNFNLPLKDDDASVSSEMAAQVFNVNIDESLPMTFDFDIIDWSSWEALFQGQTQEFVK